MEMKWDKFIKCIFIFLKKPINRYAMSLLIVNSLPLLLMLFSTSVSPKIGAQVTSKKSTFQTLSQVQTGFAKNNGFKTVL